MPPVATAEIWKINVMIGRDLPANEETVDGLLSALDKVVQEGDDPAMVCHLTRELIKAVILTRHRGLWTSERVAEGTRLLRDAVRVTEHSDYERNCATRSQDFKDALKRLIEEDDAWTDLRASLGSELLAQVLAN